MHTVFKISGRFGHERLTVRGFKYSDDMHRFLNRGDNSCTWKKSETTRGMSGLKPGTYAKVAGEWLNVRTLDVAVLAHV